MTPWFRNYAILLIVFTGLISCKSGGGGGGESGDTQAPSVKTTTPSDGTANVAADLGALIISALFDEPVDKATVDANSFVLDGPSGPVSGAVALSNDTLATFTPGKAPALATTYKATLRADVKDLAGNNLASDFSWSFQTRDGFFLGPQLGESGDMGGATNIRFAMNASGQAVVSWAEFHGASLTDLFVNHFEPGSGWQGKLPIRQNIGSASLPSMELVIDDQGNAAGFWAEREDINPPGMGPGFDSDDPITGYMATYDAGSGNWSGPVAVESEAMATSESFHLSSGGNGRFLMLFGINRGATGDFYANRYNPGEGWSGPELLESAPKDPTDTSLGRTRGFLDSQGNAMAVWTKDEDTNGDLIIDFNDRNALAARRFNVATQIWESPVHQLNPNFDGNNFGFRGAYDGNGNFLGIWYQYDGSSRANLWAARHDSSVGWETSQSIESINTHDMFTEELHMDANGNAILLVNAEEVATGNGDPLVIHFLAGSGWQIPQFLFQDDSVSAANFDMDVNRFGKAFVIWRQGPSGNRDVHASSYDPEAQSWSSPALVETTDTGDSLSPLVRVDNAGNALAVWWSDEGSERSIFANRYLAGSPWGGPIGLESSSANIDNFGFKVGVNERGEALVVFVQDVSSAARVYYNEFK